eukprot:CAMPEP_0197068802 /NCGR_PEP_ID=MMETSP1384-20130603/189055_1 /TAXON_ID=29189 /ORGANISM="Ammonia sp." /LENGTH=69 /DNA_ID=CAMNT_0042506657 /DNA_START=1 /DNA_END=206 /DNA_ORIENTATION=+
MKPEEMMKIYAKTAGAPPNQQQPPQQQQPDRHADHVPAPHAGFKAGQQRQPAPMGNVPNKQQMPYGNMP